VKPGTSGVLSIFELFHTGVGALTLPQTLGYDAKGLIGTKTIAYLSVVSVTKRFYSIDTRLFFRLRPRPETKWNNYNWFDKQTKRSPVKIKLTFIDFNFSTTWFNIRICN